MKIAVLADLHVTDCPSRTVKYDVMDWAAKEIKARKVDLVAAIGDLTAVGTKKQNLIVLQYLMSLGIPFCSTPGNAELRTSDAVGTLWRIQPAPEVPLILVDSSTCNPPGEELEALAKLPEGAGYLLATHVPVQDWPQDAQDIVAAAKARRAVTAVIAGHKHDDGEERLRGLDPDKASGGVPAFEIFENEGAQWHRTRVEMESADIRNWPLEERQALFGRFGVSAMGETLETLAAAVELRIPHVELRYAALAAVPESELKGAIARWREACGETLSMHLPNLKPENNEDLAAAVRKTLKLGCERVTLHVPAVTATEFPKHRERLIANFLKEAAPLLEAGVTIGIENLHTYPGREADDLRNYGCTIGECRSWIDALRAATGNNPLIGFHLDIGHARNNKPFNSLENLSDFYVELGAITNGCHFHQVSQKPAQGDSGNHTPLTGLYDKLISLAGFFLSWGKGEFPKRPPIFLEIRGKGAGITSFKALRHLIIGE